MALKIEDKFEIERDGDDFRIRVLRDGVTVNGKESFENDRVDLDPNGESLIEYRKNENGQVTHRYSFVVDRHGTGILRIKKSPAGSAMGFFLSRVLIWLLASAVGFFLYFSLKDLT